MGLIRIPGGWFEFEGEEPPGLVLTSSDEGEDSDTARWLRLVDDGAERRDES